MTREPLHKQRVFALDVRSKRLGYAAFERGTLLDVGVVRFESPLAAKSRLQIFMRRFRPGIVALRTLSRKSSRNCKGTRAILRIVRRVAQYSSVCLVLIREKGIRGRFLELGATTKYQIALFLVEAFPTLASRLPPPRRPWRGEHRNMAIFDAVALGFVYLDDEGDSHVACSNPKYCTMSPFAGPSAMNRPDYTVHRVWEGPTKGLR